MQADEKEIWQLHLRKAQGETLTEEELKRVQAWYDELDREEAEQLRIPTSSVSEAELTTALQAATQCLEELIRQNQLLMTHNEELRAELSALRQQLANRPPKAA